MFHNTNFKKKKKIVLAIAGMNPSRDQMFEHLKELLFSPGEYTPKNYTETMAAESEISSSAIYSKSDEENLSVNTPETEFWNLPLPPFLEDIISDEGIFTPPPYR